MLPGSLFDADYREGVKVISSFRELCGATDIRRLPGLDAETDAEIENRILRAAPYLFYGMQNGRLVFYTADVQEWWRALCAGQAFNAARRRSTDLPGDGRTTWYRGGILDEAFYRELVSEPAARRAAQRGTTTP